MYSTEERQIFGPYFDGARLRYGDPLAIHHALHALLDGNVSKWLREARSESVQQAYLARKRVLDAARQALEMSPFDPEVGRGALESDVARALNLFTDFISESKKKGPSSLTSATPSEVGPSPEPPITLPPSLSFSTASGPHGDEPGTPSEESTLPYLDLPFPPTSSTP